MPISSDLLTHSLFRINVFTPKQLTIRGGTHMSRRCKVVLSLLVYAVFCLAAPTINADTITFNNDPAGLKISGFQSVDSPIVTFSNPGGSFFLATFLTFQNTSNVLNTEDDVAGFIVMTFAVPVTAVSFDFGHNLAQINPNLTATATLTF